MALFDLQRVPWRIESAITDTYWYPDGQVAATYAAWATELGVSPDDTLLDFDGSSLATPFAQDYPLFTGATATAFISSEGGLGWYQTAPGNTASVEYDLVAQVISPMYGLATRPNLLLSFHYNQGYYHQLRSGKLQKRFGVTLLYAEFSLIGSSTRRLWVAARLEPGAIRFVAQTQNYAFAWKLTELDPATGAVVQSEPLYTQPGNTYAELTLTLSQGVGLLTAPPAFGAPGLVGTVATAGILRAASGGLPAWLGQVPVAGLLRVTADRAPAWLGVVKSPVLAVHAAPYAVIDTATAHLATPWDNTARLVISHAAAWGLRVEGQHQASWLIPLPGVSHCLAWGDPAVCLANRRLPWGDTTPVMASHAASWADIQAPRADHAAIWGVAVFPGSTLAVPWGDRAGVLVAHQDLWGDGTAPRTTHSLAWSDRSLALKAMTCSWGDGAFPLAGHAAVWGSSATPRRAHTAPWSSRPLLRPDHAAPWGNAWSVRAGVDLAWSDVVPLVPTPLVAAWSDQPVGRAALASPWGDGTPLYPEHILLWSERPVARRTHAAVYADRPAGKAAHLAAWGKATPARLTHSAVYADRPAGEAAHQASWGEPIAARLTHAVAYADRQGVEAEHQTGWGDGAGSRLTHAAVYADLPCGEAAHRAGWGEATSARLTHAAAYADRPGGEAKHQVDWGAATAARLTHAAVYADRPGGEAAHRADWGVRGFTVKAHAGGWALTVAGQRAHRAPWSLLARPQARAAHRAGWLMLEDLQLVSIENVPELHWQGRSLRIEAASLSLDEDSPVWMAEEIVIADLDAWGAIDLGDELILSIGEESWRLRVDGKGMKRPGVGELLLSLSAVSPLAWLDAPYAAQITLDNAGEAVSAQATVAALLAPVGALRWELDDWLIPPGALALSETTPVAAARTIVAAIGGLLESDPDGTPVARKRHPVSVPAYADSAPQQVILESDLFAYTVSAAPEAGCNRLVVTNDDLSGDAARDRLEYLDEDQNPYDGEMRAWPTPWRPVVLGHTGHPETVIESLGERSHSNTELIEFIGGQAQVKYPVQDLVSLTWQHTDLGDVTVQGSDLTAATPGQSLAWVTYTTRSLDWRVGLDRDESVQFVLI